MKKMLIIGVKGMAGHLLLNYYKRNNLYDVYGIARNINPSKQIFNLDVSDTSELKTIIDENKFDYIVNCIGILNKDAEDNPDKAIWFNSYFPHFLESITKDSQTKVIHISTDCVFSGKEGSYTENSYRNGSGFYAQSKALGELNNGKDLTIRTSIIGPELNLNGIGLFHWFMTQKAEADSLKGFSNVFWSGITTLELAKVIDNAIKNNVTGLKQISRKKIDKYNLLLLFNEIFKENKMEIIADGDYHSDKSLISVRDDYNYEVPDYDKMLLELKNWILTTPLYSHYG